MAISGEEKRAYQRELMRKRRAEKKGLLRVEVGGQKVVLPEAEGSGVMLRVPARRPVEATDEEWVLACERAERAVRYAEKMPEHVRPSEVRYQDPVWQWENETKGRIREGTQKV